MRWKWASFDLRSFSKIYCPCLCLSKFAAKIISTGGRSVVTQSAAFKNKILNKNREFGEHSPGTLSAAAYLLTELRDSVKLKPVQLRYSGEYKHFLVVLSFKVDPISSKVLIQAFIACFEGTWHDFLRWKTSSLFLRTF